MKDYSIGFTNIKDVESIPIGTELEVLVNKHRPDIERRVVKGYIYLNSPVALGYYFREPHNNSVKGYIMCRTLAQLAER